MLVICMREIRDVSGGSTTRFTELLPQLLIKKQEILPEASDEVFVTTSVTIKLGAAKLHKSTKVVPG